MAACSELSQLLTCPYEHMPERNHGCWLSWLNCRYRFPPLVVVSMNVLVKLWLCSVGLGIGLGPLLLLPGASFAAAACKVSKEFQGAAPSVIVQDALYEKFQRPLKRVDCRDDGLCYQRWGKNCGV